MGLTPATPWAERRCSTNGAWQAVNVIVEPMPLPPATVSAFVFEDDFPLNGEDDTGGGVDVLAPNEPGLGGFQIISTTMSASLATRLDR